MRIWLMKITMQAERDIEPERAGRHHLGLDHALALAEPHDRALAESTLDLAERGIQRFSLVHHVPVDEAQSILGGHQTGSLYFTHPARCHPLAIGYLYTFCSHRQGENGS